MGAVYEAIDTRLRNTVAVKELAVHGAAADRAFEREAQLLANLRHPVLPVVIDYFAEGRGHFFVMQYIEGEDFAARLAQNISACSEQDLVAVARAVLDALEYLHAHTPPILHRDLKPANLKRTPSGDIVLLDFGLAKWRPARDTTVDDDASVFGYTRQYAAPEQIDDHLTTVRSDLFSLGATLYHLAVGVPPPSATERTLARLSGQPDPLVPANVVNPAIGTAVGAALTRALQLAPDDRFESAAEMRSALSAVAAAPKRPESNTSERRVDAALPTRVEVGRQTDLLVQVRFANSPRLGLEDWPTSRRPDAVDQRSEPLQVVHPVDPATGRLSPARVRIKIVASDFAVEGDAERLIEVPVDDYSKRIAFLMTPRRTGFCRVNVEVYALDALYLGAVAVEAEAIGVSVPEPVLSVANMILGAFAQQAAAASRPAPGTGVPTTAASADTVRRPAVVAAEVAAAEQQRIAQALERARRELESAGFETACEAVNEVLAAAPGAPARRPPAPAAARPAPPQAAARPAPAPPAAAPKPLDVGASPPPAEMTASIQLPPPKRSLSSRLSVLGGAAAAVLIAGVVYSVWPSINPTTQAPTFTIPPLQTGGAAGAITSTPAAAPATSTAPPAAPSPRPTRPNPIPAAVPPAAGGAAPPPVAAAPAPPAMTQPAPAPTSVPAPPANPAPAGRAAPRPPNAEELARRKQEGDDAFRRARQFDALARTAEAMKEYELAVKLLPDDDPNKKIAQDRIDALRARK